MRHNTSNSHSFRATPMENTAVAKFCYFWYRPDTTSITKFSHVRPDVMVRVASLGPQLMEDGISIATHQLVQPNTLTDLQTDEHAASTYDDVKGLSQCRGVQHAS